jgi:hypothetical protein
MGELIQFQRRKPDASTPPVRRGILLQFRQGERRRKPGRKKGRISRLLRTKQFGSHTMGAEDFDRWIDNVTHMF